MEESNIFVQTISKIKNKKKAKDLIYDIKDQIKLHRIDGMVVDPQKLSTKHQNISKKYSKGLFQENIEGWNEGQRKLYLNFILTYCYLHLKQILDISLSEWNRISKAFHSKRILFLKYEAKSFERNIQRVHWTGQQESILQNCIKSEINGNWAAISYELFVKTEGESFKTARQCRQHWFNHLNAQIKKGQWTIDQDMKILNFVIQNGRHWSKINQLLGNIRTEHMIKNRFSTLINMGKKYCHISSDNKNTQSDIIQVILQYLNNNREAIYQLSAENIFHSPSSDNQPPSYSSNPNILSSKHQLQPLQPQPIHHLIKKVAQLDNQSRPKIIEKQSYNENTQKVQLKQQKQALSSKYEANIKIGVNNQILIRVKNSFADKQIAESKPFFPQNMINYNMAPLSFGMKQAPFYNSFLPPPSTLQKGEYLNDKIGKLRTNDGNMPENENEV